MYGMERWISTEKENLQKIPGWHSKLQNRISEIKDSLDRSNRMDIGKKIGEIDYRSIKII